MTETTRALGRMSERLTTPAGGSEAAAGVVVARARDRVPRVSGALADSIHASLEGSSSRVVAGGPLVDYAGVIEHGWDARNIRAQPYLAVQAEESPDPVVAAYRGAVDELVVAFGRETPG